LIAAVMGIMLNGRQQIKYVLYLKPTQDNTGIKNLFDVYDSNQHLHSILWDGQKGHIFTLFIVVVNWLSVIVLYTYGS
jgi:hypothetical protein